MTHYNEKGTFSADTMCSLHFSLDLMLYLLVSSADYLCEHFGPRSGPTKLFGTDQIRPDKTSGLICSKKFDTDGVLNELSICYALSWFPLRKLKATTTVHPLGLRNLANKNITN